MGADSSLQHRVEDCVHRLMRGKGKLRERLVDINLALAPLLPRDFTEEAKKHFVTVSQVLDKYRVVSVNGYVFYTDPSPRDRDVLAEALRLLYRECVVAEAKYWNE